MNKFWKPLGKIVLEGYQPTSNEGVNPARPPRGHSALYFGIGSRPVPAHAPMAPSGELRIKPRH